MSEKNNGQSFDDYLKETGDYAEVMEAATKRIFSLVTVLRGKVRELEEQVAAMRCCGNCEHYGDAKTCVECEEHYHLTGEKLFRWQPRTESDKGVVQDETV